MIFDGYNLNKYILLKQSIEKGKQKKLNKKKFKWEKRNLENK